MSKNEEKLKKKCESRIAKFKRQRPIRTQSLIITIFGDSVLPHGGEIWLGSLIKLVEPFGINQRLVRTSVYRLIQDDWLKAKQYGRKSYYSLTKPAIHQIRLAEKRIYNRKPNKWDGEWSLVFTGVEGVSNEQRESLRKELLWQGFGQISKNVFGHPVACIEPILEMLEKKRLDKKVVVMKARNYDDIHGPGIYEMARQCSDLDELKHSYKLFIKTYNSIYQCMSLIDKLDTKISFLLRTLLIHDYRRIILRDPQLPSELMVDNWVENEAHKLFSDLYQAMSAKVDQYLIKECETSSGHLPVIEPRYHAMKFNKASELN